MSARVRIWGLAALIDAVVIVVVAVLLLVTGGDGLNGQTGKIQGQGNSTIVGQRAPHYQTYLVNNSGGPVTIESATLLPLPGERTPTLASGPRIEMYPGDIGWGQRWHPDMPSEPMHGFVLRNGGDAYIDYTLYSNRPGFYGAAGLRLTVREGSDIDTVDAVAGDALCVYANRVPRKDASCRQLNNTVATTVVGM
jgi:hypothetical protein